MRHAYICNDRYVGSRKLRQCRNFAGVIHADLPDSDLVLRRRLQHCPGEADMIVEISFCFRDSKPAGQHCCCKILCARLAIASSDRDHAQSERSPVIRSEFLVRF